MKSWDEIRTWACIVAEKLVQELHAEATDGRLI
jgi:hypothetical protein